MGACGLDLSCYIGSVTAPFFAFFNTWWPLGLFVVGLIIGGALSNAIDRLTLGGDADFFSLHAFGFYW